MDKQKQIIEEEIVEFEKDLRECIAEDYGSVYYYISAKDLYRKGYRKIPENAVVLTREEFDEDYVTKEDRDYWKHKAEIYKEHLKKVRKETAEKFAERLKEKLNEWLEDNEDLNGKIDFGIAEIELIGVKSLDGEIISESLIDEICREITGGN